MRMIDNFEVGEPVFLIWFPGTDPDVVEFDGINRERGSFYVKKRKAYGLSHHELWPDEIGIGDTPEQAEKYLQRCIDFELIKA